MDDTKIIQIIAYYVIVGLIAIFILRMLSKAYSRFKQRSKPVTTDNINTQAGHASAPSPEQAHTPNVIPEKSLKLPHQPSSDLVVSNEFYAEAYAEIHNGENYDQGIWARAYSESEGDDEKSKALYVKLRALGLETRKQKILSDITREG